ncbi:MAG: hypothetical protein KatS3mg111_2100 [Pirellulaceae bacterium]|nr:MAG: hypothetical protein KatS3mg111_2100 [Pirellulaceae bacterium]
MSNSYVKSYFKIDDRFIPVETFSGEFPDKNYIDGAIVLTIDGQEIFTFEHWDLVDQLWCYIADGIGKLREGEDFETYFPDQPLLLRFELINKRFVRVTVGDDTYEVATETFLKTLQRGAKEFFQRMRELLPDWNDTWEKYEKAAGI